MGDEDHCTDGHRIAYGRANQVMRNGNPGGPGIPASDQRFVIEPGDRGIDVAEGAQTRHHSHEQRTIERPARERHRAQDQLLGLLKPIDPVAQQSGNALFTAL